MLSGRAPSCFLTRRILLLKNIEYRGSKADPVGSPWKAAPLHALRFPRTPTSSPQMPVSNQRISVFIAGVQKGGTTSLFGYLSAHPALSAPSRKELHVFDDEARAWGTPNLADLDTYYDPADVERLRFEATPIYLYWPPAIARLAAYNPTSRLILVFRDPVERAWSHWCMEADLGIETLSFATAIRSGRDRMDPADPLAYPWRVFSYIERGLYGAQMKRALRYFPKSQKLSLSSVELRNDRASALRRIAGFLEIGPFGEVPARDEMRRPRQFRLAGPTPEDRSYCQACFADDLADFREITGVDLSMG